MSGRIEGLDETLAAFARLGKAGQREGGKAVAATAQKVRTDVIVSMVRENKTGTVYERSPGQNLSRTHQASAPGEAPAKDSGDLISTIKAVSSGLNGRVFSRLPRSFWLEYGTLYMDPRPAFNPALQANKDYFIDQLNKAMERAAQEFNR